MNRRRTRTAVLIGLAGFILITSPLYGGGDQPTLSFVDRNQVTVGVHPLSNANVEIDEDVLFEVTVKNNYESAITIDLWFTVDLTGVDHEKRVRAPYLDRESPISGVIDGSEEVVLRFRARPLEGIPAGPYTFYLNVGYNTTNFVISQDKFQGTILNNGMPDYETGFGTDEWVISSVWAVNDAGRMFLAEQGLSSRKTVAMVKNYPNPFNPSTNLLYKVNPTNGLSAPVKLDIYDIRGRHVRTLVERSHTAGIYTVGWDGRDARGRKVDSGIYLFQLQSGRDISLKKGVLTER